MKLLSLVYLLYSINCAVPCPKDHRQTIRPSSELDNQKEFSNEVIPTTTTITSLPSDDIGNQPDHSDLKSKGSEGLDAHSLLDRFKGCLESPEVIYVLFKYDHLLCDGVRSLSNDTRLILIDQSQTYLLDLFNLPSHQTIVTMNQLSEYQFNSTLFHWSEGMGIDLRKSYKNGMQFVLNHLTRNGSGIMESILHHYWSYPSFHTKFINRLFSSLASTLTTQEYFELESLIDWIQSNFQIMTEQDYDDLRNFIKFYYRVSYNSLNYWWSWYNMRPLLY